MRLPITNTDRIEKELVLRATRSRVWRAIADAQEFGALRLVESGFDKLPESRRVLAFRSNDGGWTALMPRIERHVAAG